jgi:serine O-acetyltransferase
MFDNLREDYRVHDGHVSSQGFWVMIAYRFGRWRYTVRPRALRAPLSFVYRVMKTATQILTGIDLPCETTIGRRFRIDHFGGVIISGDAVIGDDVVVRNGVTIGLRRRDDPGSPVIGNRVDIGAGAKILGRIRVGDDVIIGANAVVIRDVPPGSIAVGVPARVIARTDLTGGVPFQAAVVPPSVSLSASEALDMALSN